MEPRNSPTKKSALRAYILAFPLARRYSLVKKLASQMLARSSAAADGHLAFELQRHRRTLRNRKLSDDVIEREVRMLEAAVRAELWRTVVTPEQPSGAS
jgi:hypothetical protein